MAEPKKSKNANRVRGVNIKRNAALRHPKTEPFAGIRN